MVCVVVCIFSCAFYVFVHTNRRKRRLRITKEVNSWNINEGIPRGIYFALGVEDGTTGHSPDDFWRGIYPTKISRSINGGGLCNIELSNNLKPKLHLYVDPTVRREYCTRTGANFYLPSQHDPSQTLGAGGWVAHNINNETSDDNGQPLLQPPVPPPSFNPNFIPPAASDADAPPPSAPAFVFDLQDPPPSYDSVVKQAYKAYSRD